jgi:hypothetical protein
MGRTLVDGDHRARVDLQRLLAPMEEERKRFARH